MNWRPIPGYTGLYEVSDEGAVRSLDRQTHRCNGTMRKIKGKVLSSFWNGGYLTVALSKNGKVHPTAVHLLVLRAFVGPCPPCPPGHRRMEGCHWDDNPSNNQSTNLRWATSKANKGDAARNGRVVRGEKQHLAKLTEIDVRRIRRLYATGDYDLGGLSKKFGVNLTNVHLIVRRKTWRHI